jgi:uncharacterized delta-60 repeat protein
MEATMRENYFLYLLLIITLFLSVPAQAKYGEINTNFGDNGLGFVMHEIAGSTNSQANALAVDSEGNLVVAGTHQTASYSDILLARFNSDGEIDTTFGDSDGSGGQLGYTTLDLGTKGDDANAIVINDDGTILVAGSTWTDSKNITDMIVLRYTADGTLDTTFGDDDGSGTGTKLGYTLLDIDGKGDAFYAMVTDSAGRIVVTGGSDYTFGYDVILARYTADGELDNTFGTTDMSTAAQLGYTHLDFGDGHDIGYALTLDSEERIVVTGQAHQGRLFNIFVARFDTNGDLDTGFGEESGSSMLGYRIMTLGNFHDIGRSVETNDDDEIILAAQAMNYYTADDDGNIAAGYDVYLAKFNTVGAFDTSFGDDDGAGAHTGYTTFDINSQDDIPTDLILANDKILVVGYSDENEYSAYYALLVGISTAIDNKRTMVAQFTLNGELDTDGFGSDEESGYQTFDFSEGEDDQVYALAMNDTGDLYLAGAARNSSYNTILLTYLDYSSICGNAETEGSESCDDGNTDDNDGCSSICESEIDADSDGYYSDEDCDDNDASINPAATETCGDDIDQNCDGSDEACPVEADSAEPNDFISPGDDINGGSGNIQGTGMCSMITGESSDQTGYFGYFAMMVLLALVILRKRTNKYQFRRGRS